MAILLRHNQRLIAVIINFFHKMKVEADYLLMAPSSHGVSIFACHSTTARVMIPAIQIRGHLVNVADLVS
ncbi:MAG: hypothetical protein NTY60_06925 [Proteobacteria bacterium]|nr:hypothetical protein [Pseudomonadota bacterium]